MKISEIIELDEKSNFSLSQNDDSCEDCWSCCDDCDYDNCGFLG